MLVPVIGSARCSGLCRQHSLCSHVESVFDCHRSPSPSQCLFGCEASCWGCTIRQGPMTLEFSLLFDLFKVCITRIASSINFVEEIHELLKIYFVVWFYTCYLNHSCTKNWQLVHIWKDRNGLKFKANVYNYLLWSSSSETVSSSKENTTFKSSELIYPFLKIKWQLVLEDRQPRCARCIRIV